METTMSGGAYLSARKTTQQLAKQELAIVSETLNDIAIVARYGGGIAALLDPKNTSPSAKKSMEGFTAAAGQVTQTKPFSDAGDLKLPLDNPRWRFKVTPFSYRHAVQTEDGEKAVIVTTPLKWVVSFEDYGIDTLGVLLGQRGMGDSVRQYAGYFLLLHFALLQPNIKRIFERMRYTPATTTMPEFGNLPMTVVGLIPTVRPSDQVIVEMTDLSGVDRIEEVLDYEAIRNLRDPMRERLEAVAGRTCAAA